MTRCRVRVEFQQQGQSQLGTPRTSRQAPARAWRVLTCIALSDATSARVLEDDRHDRRRPRPSLYGLENKAGVHEAYLAPQQEQSEMVAGTF
jgi:hypothetical protein